MAHVVKCKVCGQQFDRDKIPCIAVSAKRYAHIKCATEAGLSGQKIEPPKKDKDLIALEDYIMKLFNEDYINARIKKQIKEYKEEYNFSYSGILKTLIYFFEIRGNSIDKANGGIGIVPYIYKEANQYYYNLYLAKIANEQKDMSAYIPKVKYIEIAPPKIEKRKIRLFNFDE